MDKIQTTDVLYIPHISKSVNGLFVFEKKENMVVLTVEELEKIISNAFNAGRIPSMVEHTDYNGSKIYKPLRETDYIKSLLP